MTKDEEIMAFLHDHIFDPILEAEHASKELKQGVRMTIMRLNQLDPAGKIQYYWSAIVGTERSVDFARRMRDAGFVRFEEVIDAFRDQFNDRWLDS